MSLRRCLFLVAVVVAVALGGPGCHDSGALLSPPHADLAADLAVSDGPSIVTHDLASGADFAVAPDLAKPPSVDAGLACVAQFGAGLSAAFGRIDGTLTAVVTPADSACPNDDNHVILQVRMNGSVYQLWVNIGTDVDPMSTDSVTAQLGAPPWAEGWHTDATLDYVQTFALSSSAFTVTSPASVIQQLAMLPIGQPISVYATGYGPDGAHDVHRQATGQDGAVVISPTTSPSYLLYRFSDQSF